MFWTVPMSYPKVHVSRRETMAEPIASTPIGFTFSTNQQARSR
jgi:hypothetical protein